MVILNQEFLAGAHREALLDCQARPIHVDLRTVAHYVFGLLLLRRGPSELRVAGGAWEGDYVTDIF